MLNAIKMLGIKIIKATQTGNKFNQHKSIKASYLILGKVALNHTNIKQNIQVIQLNKTIEAYSAKKKKTKGTLECSVKKPATNSDSASCKSKGVLDVSANIDIK